MNLVLSLQKYAAIVALAMIATSLYLQNQISSFQLILDGVPIDSNAQKPRLRILHVVTSSVLYKEKHDRFRGTLLPTILGTANSFASSQKYEIDFQLILGYVLPTHLRREIQEALTEIDPGIGLFIWDDAMPYKTKINEMNETKRVNYNQALARQHRYVVRAHINSDGTQNIVYSNGTGSWENGFRHNSNILPRPYDMYSCWEDDMLIQSRHFDHYLGLTKKLEGMASVANSTGSFKNSTDVPLSKSQLLRMIPGFIRAEVVMDANETHMHSNATKGKHQYTVDCCNVTNQQIVIWETNPNGIRIRPPSKSVGTLGLLRVAHQQYSVRAGSIDVGNPNGIAAAKLFAQQGGWMATKQQVRRFEKYCSGIEFLPPFKGNHGLVNTVEFWSGGFQLFGERSRCSMQRVIPLDDTDGWSNSLVWHASNNKHKRSNLKKRAWDARLMREEILERYREGKTEGKTHLFFYPAVNSFSDHKAKEQMSHNLTEIASGSGST